jgi:1-acyl-sn-glycerol-3-phosphate acyltransferase
LSGGDLPPAPVSTHSFRYRFLRGLIRIWVNLFFRKTRFLNPGALADGCAVLLIIGHPASFLDALLLVTAFDRQVHCLLDRRFLRGPWRGLFGWLLSMISFEPEGEGFRRAIERARDVLRNGHALLVFADEQVAKPGEPSHFSPTPALIAMQAESQSSSQLGLKIYPVHLFLPVAQLYSSELLIRVDTPLIPGEYLAKGGNMTEHARALTAASEEVCRQNVFRLQPEDVRLFLCDLEEVLRADLMEDWDARPNWKQKLDGFGLSQFVAEWVEQLNRLHPGQLVAMRDLLDSYRETQRRCSLGQLEVDQAGEWVKTVWGRIACWIESALGLPLAVYGLINHLAPCLIFYRAGLFDNKAGQRHMVKWAVRVLVVVGSYAVQILICAEWLGRTITGYYALTLPLSGAYLWRYAWLVQHRSRLLLLDLRVRREAAKLAPLRKELIQAINAARDIYAEMLEQAR